ncbi:nucleoside hydrolase [Oscillospiraceae bacterium HV4-5-C5C]|nr:nucleoside hydrolase [Oscillospiraceae bacterium HV4-5-C5C]
MSFAPLPEEFLLKRLQRPVYPADVVLDTDTYNEMDDQFALSYLIRSEDRLRLKGIHAAPFFNHHSESPADGMEKSYQEILKLLQLLDRRDLEPQVARGSAGYLPSEQEPVESPAARRLAELGLAQPEERPLYVVAIGAITNVASALLLAPELNRKLVVIWLGGNRTDWPDNREFNLEQDIAGARVLFDSGVPLVLLPCQGVVSSFLTTAPELTAWLKGQNPLCDYLWQHSVAEASLSGQRGCWSRPIWDVTAVAWLLDQAFMRDRLLPRPIPTYDGHWALDLSRPLYREVFAINRDALMTDLLTKLRQQPLTEA